MEQLKVVSRRHFLKALGNGILVGTLLSTFIAILRHLYWPLSEKAEPIARAGYPEQYAVGEVRFIPSHQLWVIRTLTGFYALKAECTHMQCTPIWQSKKKQFQCPCHNSLFHKSGRYGGGPAPRSLERFKIYLSNKGEITIDKQHIFLQEKGEWEDPAAFLKYKAPRTKV